MAIAVTRAFCRLPLVLQAHLQIGSRTVAWYLLRPTHASQHPDRCHMTSLHWGVREDAFSVVLSSLTLLSSMSSRTGPFKMCLEVARGFPTACSLAKSSLCRTCRQCSYSRRPSWWRSTLTRSPRACTVGPSRPQVQAGFEKAGLHGNAFRCIPIFCAYLSILMHTYSLVRQQVQA